MIHFLKIRWPRLVTVLLASALSACAVQVARDANPEDDPNNGVVVFSVSHDRESGSRAKAIVYLDEGTLSTAGSAALQSSNYPIPGGNDFEEVQGRLYVLSLPAGDHQFSSWVIADSGTGQRIVPGKGAQVLRFRVDGGKIKYLGNLHASVESGRGDVAGASKAVNGAIEVKDEQERDGKVLLEKYPQYAGKVGKDLLRMGPWVGAEPPKSSFDMPMFMPPFRFLK
ncbi:hypothetical protein [Variovorax rhizosphaerae]|uniref:DUF2846 domain-containing protein n=1 Tax=Variovorax rhizosphaerae TaxID=1836200 RepID=A0ABU8WI12_9BURK